MTGPCILIAGTWDTKDAELGYLRDVILRQGGRALTMDDFTALDTQDRERVQTWVKRGILSLSSR